MKGQIISKFGQVSILKGKQFLYYLFTSIKPLNVALLEKDKIVLPFVETIDTYLKKFSINFTVKKVGNFTFFNIDNQFIIPGKNTTIQATQKIQFEKLTLEEKNLLHFLVNSNDIARIFQYRLYALIVQDYIMMTYTKFNQYLKENKDMESIKPVSNDLDEKIQKYIDIVVEWIDDDVRWMESETFSPLWDNNPTIYKDEKLFLPYCLKEKIFYLIRWNELNAELYWQENYKINQIPSFYQYSTQFEQQSSKDNNLIQTSYILYPEMTFQKIYDIKTLSKPYFLLYNILYYTRLNNNSVYGSSFLSGPAKSNVYGFFYTEKNIKKTDETLEKLLKSLQQYSKKKEICIDLDHPHIAELPSLSLKEKNELIKNNVMPPDANLQNLPTDFDFRVFTGSEFYFSIFLL